MIIPFVSEDRHCQFAYTFFSTVLTLAGLYYPIFYLQLKAIENGITAHLAFYTVISFPLQLNLTY